MSVASKDVLRFVNVVFRHGNRTPTNFEMDLVGSDERHDDFHPVGMGQLTDEGKRNMHTLGTKLRKRYDSFLGTTWVPGNVEARSTATVRTKMSMTHVLAGLYPQPEVQGFSPELKTHPIPITSLRPGEDTMLVPFLSIPRYLAEVKRIGESPEAMKMAEEFRGLAEKLSKFTTKPVNSVCDMWILLNGLMSLKEANSSLPQWAEDALADGGLLAGTCLQYRIFSYNDLMKKFNAGVLLKKMIDDMKTATQSDGAADSRKINLFSCHEMNMVGLLSALGLYDPHLPEYSSAIILELVQRDEAFYVKIVYYLGIPAEFEELTMSERGTLCPLDEFIDLTRNFIPLDEEVAVVPDNKHDFLTVPEEFQWGKFNLPPNTNTKSAL